MKYLIILADGAADEPIDSLGDKTPLEYAFTPNIDRLAKMGRSGVFKSVPKGFMPGSEIANLAVLGYDLNRVFEGRGSLEAASMGVEILDGEMAMRCNLITIENGNIKNHSAGHVSNDEAKELIDYLQSELGGGDVNLFSGISYRHLLKVKGGDKNISCTPPHDVPGTPFMDVMIRAERHEAESTAKMLNELILKSQKLLENHPVNIKRISEGKEPANSIWLWSAGYRPKMTTLLDTYHFNSGAVISAVDLIKGIGVYAGLKPIEVEGATGLYNTNYEGKAQAAIEALRSNDFVYLHIEASDEAGHEGDVMLKVKTIEDLDSRVVKVILDEVLSWNKPVAIALLPDHPTPCRLKTHTADPVPFIIYRPDNSADKVEVYNENSAKEGFYGVLEGDEFMKKFTQK